MEASPDPCRPSCRAAGGEGEQLGMLRSGSGPWVPGTSIGGHGASTGAFWPEEVTEKWVGASESPRNSRRGQTLLLGAREGLWPFPADAPKGERPAQAPGCGPQQPPHTEGWAAAAFRVAHVRPVPSVQCLRVSREERCPTLEYCRPAWGRGR